MGSRTEEELEGIMLHHWWALQPFLRQCISNLGLFQLNLASPPLLILWSLFHSILPYSKYCYVTVVIWTYRVTHRKSILLPRGELYSSWSTLHFLFLCCRTGWRGGWISWSRTSKRLQPLWSKRERRTYLYCTWSSRQISQKGFGLVRLILYDILLPRQIDPCGRLKREFVVIPIIF